MDETNVPLSGEQARQPDQPSVPSHPRAVLPDIGEALLRDREVAAILRVDRRSVWRWASAGKIPGPISVGSLKRWKASSLRHWLAAKGGAQ